MRRSFGIVLALTMAIVSGCGGDSGGTTVVQAKSNLKAVFLYSFNTPSSTGVINEQDKTINVTVPFGTNVTALVASFATTGHSVTVNGTTQFSGAAANDFTNPVHYVVTAEDDSTATYTVTVTVASSSAKAITLFSFTNPAVSGIINEFAKTIDVTVPFGTGITSLVATFTHTGQSMVVNGLVQVSGTTANDFLSPLTFVVTAADGTSQNYTVNVTVAPSSAKDISAFWFANPAATGIIDQVAKTIAVTVPFGTNVTALVASFSSSGASVKVGATAQTSSTNANNFTNSVNYTVTAADGTTQNYTVTVAFALNPAKDFTAYAIGASIGIIDQVNKTIAVTVPFGTNITALVATFATSGAAVKVGETTQVNSTTANDFTSSLIYTVTAQDGTSQPYTVTVTVALNSAKDITSYDIGTSTGVIDQVTKSITVTVPFGTNVTALVASFNTTGVSVAIGETTQVNGITANDFTGSVTYTVTAQDGFTQNYTVTVTAALNSAKDMTAFEFREGGGTIDQVAKTIAVAVPFGTDVTALAASFTTTGVSVTVNEVAQDSGITPNDFTNPLVYMVTAQDGSTQNYTVTVTIPPAPKAITAFWFNLGGANGVIDEAAKTIAVEVPVGTSVSALVANFTITGASVTVGATTQVSGTTGNDFTNSVLYMVTGQDGFSVSYTVTVTVLAKKVPRFAYVANAGGGISAYTINGGTGALTMIVGAAAGTAPVSVTVDPSGKFAFVANSGGSNVSAYTIDLAKGLLAQIGSFPAGTKPVSVTVDPTGRFAYVANQTSNDVSAYTITAGGALIPIDADVGTAGMQNFPAGTNPSSVTVDPTGKFAYVTNYNSANVSAYTIDAGTGALTPVAGSPFTSGTQPSSVAVDPTGKFVYVANYGSANVSAYTIDSVTGALTLPGVFPAGTSPVSVTVDSAGKFAYAANSAGVSANTIDSATGALTGIGTQVAGTQPSSVTVDPTGAFAYVANFISVNISVYSINSATGVLTGVGNFAAGTGPASVVTVAY